MTNQDVRYGSDDTGRVWRTHPNPSNSEQLVLEVANPGESVNWDLWGIVSEVGLDALSQSKGILWLQNVIEV